MNSVGVVTDRGRSLFSFLFPFFQKMMTYDRLLMMMDSFSSYIMAIEVPVIARVCIRPRISGFSWRLGVHAFKLNIVNVTLATSTWNLK